VLAKNLRHQLSLKVGNSYNRAKNFRHQLSLKVGNSYNSNKHGPYTKNLAYVAKPDFKPKAMNNQKWKCVICVEVLLCKFGPIG